MNYSRVLQWVSGYIAVYHLLIGVLGIFASTAFMQDLISFFYGATLPVDATLFYTAKFVGAYFIAFGGMMWLVAMNPSKYQHLVWVAVLFFVIRLGELAYFYNFLGEHFQITDARILEKILIIIVLAGGLILCSLKQKTQRSML